MLNINDEYPVEHRIRIMAGQIYAAAKIGMWCFGENQHLYYSTCPNEKEFLSFLKLDGCLDFAYSKENGWDKPVILSDSMGLLWIAEHVYKHGKPDIFMIIGPMFLSKISVKNIEDYLETREPSIYTRRQMIRILSEVPVLLLSMVKQYAAMLHYIIKDEMIRSVEFYYQNQEINQKFSEIFTSYINLDPDYSTSGEKQVLKAIKDGNINYRNIIDQEINFEGGFISDTGDSIRDGKNTLLVFNGLCSRAAIDGGLPVKVAKKMEMKNTNDIEKCKSISQLINVNLKIIDDYVYAVRESHKNPQISKTIQECCDYIRANIQNVIDIDDIANNLGYTPYYFTKKFHSEMGIRITDYIKQARIDYAKIALISTNKSIQEISDYLQFGTRNYFTKVFHDIVGVTPVSYRENMGRES
jgi:YesN/AraC family two-component response regulator